MRRRGEEREEEKEGRKEEVTGRRNRGKSSGEKTERGEEKEGKKWGVVGFSVDNQGQRLFAQRNGHLSRYKNCARYSRQSSYIL